jgi:polyribonucleotide nucleotidyltransferase
VTVISADQENDADVLGVLAASTALAISPIPWDGPIAAVRVGQVEGNWILNPTFQQLEFSTIDLFVMAPPTSIVMVEGGALEFPEGSARRAESARRHQERSASRKKVISRP